jgi:tRNA (guanine37-N1)-methyltransferase
MDACIRILPDVMGNTHTTDEESFENGLLEYPLYTRPAIWKDPAGQDHSVPEVLTSGHHKKIKDWQLEQSKQITKARRPDLWKKYENKIGAEV